MAGCSHRRGFSYVKLEETRACLFAIKEAQRYGHDQLIVESDCWHRVAKLKKKFGSNNSLGLSVLESLSLNFQLISFRRVKRGGNFICF